MKIEYQHECAPLEGFRGEDGSSLIWMLAVGGLTKALPKLPPQTAVPLATANGAILYSQKSLLSLHISPDIGETELEHLNLFIFFLSSFFMLTFLCLCLEKVVCF